MTDDEFEALHRREDEAWRAYQRRMSDASSARAEVTTTYLAWRELSNEIMAERTRRNGER